MLHISNKRKCLRQLIFTAAWFCSFTTEFLGELKIGICHFMSHILYPVVSNASIFDLLSLEKPTPNHLLLKHKIKYFIITVVYFCSTTMQFLGERKIETCHFTLE